jgi:hypothetical protein
VKILRLDEQRKVISQQAVKFGNQRGFRIGFGVGHNVLRYYFTSGYVLPLRWLL